MHKQICVFSLVRKTQKDYLTSKMSLKTEIVEPFSTDKEMNHNKIIPVEDDKIISSI